MFYSLSILIFYHIKSRVNIKCFYVKFILNKRKGFASLLLLGSVSMLKNEGCPTGFLVGQ